MAQHASAEKRARQTIKRTLLNRERTGKIRASMKSVEAAIVSGDKNKAMEALKAARPILMSGVSKGVFNMKAASRKMSRLSARVKAIRSSA